MHKLDATVRKGLENFQKGFEELTQGTDKDAEQATDFFKDAAKKCKEAISNSPILKALSNFLESACNLIKSVVTGKDAKESWDKFKESASKVVASVKEAVMDKGKV